MTHVAMVIKTMKCTNGKQFNDMLTEFESKLYDIPTGKVTYVQTYI